MLLVYRSNFSKSKRGLKSGVRYMGGHTVNPTYKDICGGDTGHAEIIQIEYDENESRFEDLLLVFFKTHDPTTLNRQGADAGTQYRSVVFYETQEQKAAAENMIDKLEKKMVFDRPIVTEITPVSEFYAAEDYHQNYFNTNPNQSYCAFVIQPKLAKFTKEFGGKIRNPPITFHLSPKKVPTAPYHQYPGHPDW